MEVSPSFEHTTAKVIDSRELFGPVVDDEEAEYVSAYYMAESGASFAEPAL